MGLCHEKSQALLCISYHEPFQASVLVFSSIKWWDVGLPQQGLCEKSTNQRTWKHFLSCKVLCKCYRISSSCLYFCGSYLTPPSSVAKSPSTLALLFFRRVGPALQVGLGWESGVRSNRVWIHFLAPLDMIHWTLGWDSISVRFETARIYLIRSWLTSYSWTFLPGTMPDTMQGMLWCQSIEMKHFCEQKRASSMCQRQAVEWNTKATWVFWRPVC